MNAVKLFREKVKNAEFNISSDGTISFIFLEKMTPQEMEDLSHLRISNVNGILFDDREKPIKEDF